MPARSPLLGLRRLTSAITDEPRLPERRHRVAGRRYVEQPRAELGLGDLRLPPGQVLAHARDDVVEHGHDDLQASGAAESPPSLSRDPSRPIRPAAAGARARRLGQQVPEAA